MIEISSHCKYYLIIFNVVIIPHFATFYGVIANFLEKFSNYSLYYLI